MSVKDEIEEQKRAEIEERQRLLAHEQTALICAKDIMVAYIGAGRFAENQPGPNFAEAKIDILNQLFTLAREIFVSLHDGIVWDQTIPMD